jgi:hypothetical protein
MYNHRKIVQVDTCRPKEDPKKLFPPTFQMEAFCSQR